LVKLPLPIDWAPGHDVDVTKTHKPSSSQDQDPSQENLTDFSIFRFGELIERLDVDSSCRNVYAETAVMF